MAVIARTNSRASDQQHTHIHTHTRTLTRCLVSLSLRVCAIATRSASTQQFYAIMALRTRVDGFSSSQGQTARSLPSARATQIHKQQIATDLLKHTHAYYYLSPVPVFLRAILCPYYATTDEEILTDKEITSTTTRCTRSCSHRIWQCNCAGQLAAVGLVC